MKKPEFYIGCNKCGYVHRDWTQVGGGIIMVSHPKYKKTYKHIAIGNKIKCNKCGSVCFCGTGEVYALRPNTSYQKGIAGEYKGKIGENEDTIYFRNGLYGALIPIL